MGRTPTTCYLTKLWVEPSFYVTSVFTVGGVAVVCCRNIRPNSSEARQDRQLTSHEGTHVGREEMTCSSRVTLLRMTR